MSSEFNQEQERIAALESQNQDLQAALAQVTQCWQDTVEELQTVKADLERLHRYQSESEKFLHLAINHIPEPIFWKDRDSVFLGCNQYFANFAGLTSPSEIIGKTDYDLPWQREETEKYRADDRRVMESDTPELKFVESIQQQDGNHHWVETNKVPLHDRSGEVVGILGTFIDITDRVIAEQNLQKLNQDLEQEVTDRTQKLQATEARLQRLADNLPGLIFQFRMERDGTPSFPYVSEGCRDLYGLDPENFIQSFDWVHPTDLPLLKQAIEKSRQSLKGFQHEHRIITPQGEVKWVQVISRPEKQPDGAVVWDGMIIDIGDRKQTEERLRQQEAQYRQIFETVTDGLAIVDLEAGKLVQINRAFHQMHDYEYEEFMQLSMADFIHPQALPLFANFLSEIKAGRSFTCLGMNVDRHGHLIEVEVKGIPYPYQDKTHALAILRDVSDRKRQERALQSIVEGTASQTGEGFFQSCVKFIALSLQVAYAFIVEVTDEENQLSGNVLAAWEQSDFGETFAYELQGTPCINVVQNKTMCRYTQDLQSRFPGDRYLIEIEAESYVGIPILNPQEELLGFIAVLDTKPMETDLDWQASILEIFAARAGAEIERIRAENALRQKEALLQMTLEAGKMGCWSWNRYTNDVMWSDGVEGILGLPPGSFQGRFEDYVGLIHPEDRDSVLSVIEETLEKEEEFSIEHRIVSAEGKIQWLRSIGETWRNEQGEAIGLLGSVLNDTHRKMAEIALTKSAQRIEKQAQRAELLNQIANQIRTSLDLDQILQTTVHEIQQFLEVDRTHFAWYVEEADRAYWDIVSEVTIEGLPSFVGKHPVDNFGPLSELLLSRKIVQLDDISTVEDQETQEILMALGNQSMLVLPIATELEQFGIIACIQTQRVRPWRTHEVDFLEAVVAQVAIALQQADLLWQSQSRAQELERLLEQLKWTQTQLIQSEKMSGLGQMVAGVAHEINNPVNFIHGNISHAQTYSQDLMNLVKLYQQYYPQPHPDIQAEIEVIDLEFIQEDCQKIFHSMKVGTHRIREIVQSLRTFSRLDESELKAVDLHEGIESTLSILNPRLRAMSWRSEIEVIKDYGQLPLVECYARQLNQVFMNILGNALDALEEKERHLPSEKSARNKIWIETRDMGRNVVIQITDNGLGMSKETQRKLFDPFYTTKPVGKGTGLGLSISYQIITEKHGGSLSCLSVPGETTFKIEIPIVHQK
ncbi:PAS domain S-box protein [Roseofilum capinflatum]|uniref:histidine kinase n=1 Tax=Roseofilum capinflatum BLCC-M114 TaxID=3022440 RepID=A0ABT7BC07_9CYAN|nr:PAS domain S-box protein [Roseofilum capinflatum]MDJ1176727.1 PAS domain S-box protein [Roseofilum capinflatum BLCC-M114]